MIHLTVILLYLFTLVGIGIYKAGKIKTHSDFAVAGRSLGPWVLVGTMLATWMGTGSILGNALGLEEKSKIINITATYSF